MREKTRVFCGDVEYIHTSIMLPKEVRDRAKTMKINLSDVLVDALMIKFDASHTELKNNMHRKQREDNQI